MSTRYNRVKIEWSKVLQPIEYTLLDYILFRSNLTLANQGEGYKFHVRNLEEACNIGRSTISRAFAQWGFMHKKGSTKDCWFQFDYDAFTKWIQEKLTAHIVPQRDNRPSLAIVPQRDNISVIVPHGDNDCPTVGRISNIGEVRIKTGTCTLPKAKTETVSTGSVKVGNNVPPERSEGFPPPAGVQAPPPLGGKSDCPTVGQSTYTFERLQKMPLPNGVQNIPSNVRQKAIVKELNIGGNFTFEVTGGTDGYRFTGIDWKNKIILVTADDPSFINNSTTQAMFSHFDKKGYKAMLWAGNDQEIYEVKKAV